VRELIDCHVHTARCGHARGTVAECVEHAVRGGLATIAFTEHLALPEQLDPDRRLSMHPSQLGEYLAEVADARQHYPQIDVVTGLEADFLPDRADETAVAVSEARSGGVTMVLGSVHFIGEWAFDDPHCLDEWSRRDVDEVWREYFDLWIRAVRSQLFDVMAHPDLVKKFGYLPSFDPSDLYDTCARAAAESGVRVEVSTAGLRKPVGEVYPGHAFLSAFRSNGVPATIGSDAHAPEEVGYRIDAAYEALRAAGYVSVACPSAGGDWKELPI
jgi:histidinol-phosphatase (PHP family)